MSRLSDHELDRRELLKAAGFVTLGASIFGGLPLTAASGATAKAKKGGTLRVGVVGSTNDILDGQTIVAKADQARMIGSWETLLAFDQTFTPVNTYGLAESVETPSLSRGVVRLRKGLTFHDGTPVTADSMIYSFQRLLDKSLGLASQKALAEFFDPNGMKKLDPLTVDFTLLKPTVGFKATLAGYTNTIVPVGYKRNDPKSNIGTGPYRVTSFTPGRESVHVKNTKYWKKGKPTFDEVRIIDFADKTALVNALLAGQIDAAIDIPLTSIPQISGNPNLAVNEIVAGGWLCFAMLTDRAPFNDPKVRQAMRLLVNRKEMLDRALGGRGEIANDLFGYIDPFYNANKFPQREQDIKKAVELLAAAGFTAAKPLEFELAAPDDTGGLIPMVQTFAEQAKATNGVVKITPKAMDSTYWDSVYTKAPMYTSYWSPRAYLPQIAATTGYGETLYEKTNPAYQELFVKASGEGDDNKRKELVKQLQKLDYEDGAYIIPVFNSFADGFTKKLKGVQKRPSQLNLDYYGRGWQDLSFG